MKLGFIFSHGWAFHKPYWNKLLPYFKSYPCMVLDHGYYGLTYLPHLNQETNWVGIGHSLGFIKLLQQGNIFKALVGLQAFTYFLAGNKHPNRMRSVEWAMMKKKFKDDPQKTIQNFNGLTASELNFHRLIHDLDLLAQNHEPLYNKFRDILTLILYTTDDRVVPSEIIEGNFRNYPKVQFKKMPDAKHLLGLRNSQQVATSIKEFLKCF